MLTHHTRSVCHPLNAISISSLLPCRSSHGDTILTASYCSTSAKLDLSSLDTSLQQTGPWSSWVTEVTSKSGRPQGTMWSKYSRSVLTFKAKPCEVVACEICTPSAAILRSSIQTPVLPAGCLPCTCKRPNVTFSMLGSVLGWQYHVHFCLLEDCLNGPGLACLLI